MTLLGSPQAALSTETALRFDGYELDLAAGAFIDLATDQELPELELVHRCRPGHDAGQWLADFDTPPLPPELEPAPADEAPALHPELADERALIGVLLCAPEKLGDVEEEVGTSDFLSHIHASLYGVFFDALHNEYRPTLAAIDAALALPPGHEVFPGYPLGKYLARLMAEAPGPETARDYARAIRLRADQEDKPGRSELDYEPEPPRPSRFKLTAFDHVLTSSRVRYLVQGLLPRTGTVVIWGPPKCGKSFWLFDVLMHVALGWEYRGAYVEQGPVVYLVLEGADGFNDRVVAFKQHHLSGHTSPVPFYLVRARVDLVKDHRALIADLQRQLGGVRPMAVAIDTLNRSFVGSESSDEDMTAYVNAAGAVSETLDCVVPIVHHCGVAGERPRGHTALTGGADMQIAVTRDAHENIKTAVEYAKDGPSGHAVLSRLRSFSIGTDERGFDITSSVVVPLNDAEAKDAASGKKRFKLSGSEELLFKALVDAVADSGVAAPGDLKLPPSVKTVVDFKFVRTAYRKLVLQPEDDETAHAERIKKQIQRAGAVLRKFGIIGVSHPWVWWTGKPVRSEKEGPMDPAMRPAQPAAETLSADIEEFE